MNLNITENKLPETEKLTLEDKWIVSRYNILVKEVTENLKKFELGLLYKNSTNLYGMNFVTGILN